MADQGELVLVTGGSGFLGSHVIKILQENGYRVRATVRSLADEEKVKGINEICTNAKFKVEVVEADLANADPWFEAVKGCTYVHHVAAKSFKSPNESDDDVVKSAVQGTLNILEACAASGTVKRFVLTGSQCCISIKAGNSVPYTEDDWQDPDMFGTDFYTKSKILCEKAAWEFVSQLSDERKFELTVLHPTLLTGPTLLSTPFPTSLIIRRLLQREMPVLVGLFFLQVDVRDVAFAHFRSMTLPEAAGQRLIISTGSITFKDMALLLKKEFSDQGYRVPTVQLPKFAFNFLKYIDKGLKRVESITSEMKVDVTKMRTVLGINDSKPVDESILDMAYSCIDKGIIWKTPAYRGRKGDH